MQSPAQSFVPLTHPTNLQPTGAVGFTCTSGLPPTVGGLAGAALWAWAMAGMNNAVNGCSHNKLHNITFRLANPSGIAQLHKRR
jgi:hypothetical protein